MKMTRKGYHAIIRFDKRDAILVGRLQGITENVSFHAETRKGLPQAMKEAVNSYLETDWRRSVSRISWIRKRARHVR